MSGVNGIISDPGVRQILFESLTFENAQSECKRLIRILNARSASIDERIRNTAQLI